MAGASAGGDVGLLVLRLSWLREGHSKEVAVETEGVALVVVGVMHQLVKEEDSTPSAPFSCHFHSPDCVAQPSLSAWVVACPAEEQQQQAT